MPISMSAPSAVRRLEPNELTRPYYEGRDLAGTSAIRRRMPIRCRARWSDQPRHHTGPRSSAAAGAWLITTTPEFRGVPLGPTSWSVLLAILGKRGRSAQGYLD